MEGAPDGGVPPPQLKRSLDARHLQMLAIASSIGTGLFIGSRGALRNGGPLTLVLAFTWFGCVLATMMRTSASSSNCFLYNNFPRFLATKAIRRN